MLPGKVACKLLMPANTSQYMQGSGAADAADAQGEECWCIKYSGLG